MMKITILTIFPRYFDSMFAESILARALERGLFEVETVDIRPFSARKHKNTDDEPYGGGAGMVMLAQPIIDAMRSVQTDGCRRIFLSPRGPALTQKKAEELANLTHLVLLCGHYEGVDQRALDACIDEELSIGDYVLTGGETAAMVLVDSVARLIPGVLGCEESAVDESFTSGLLEYPQYTRPRNLDGMEVPEVLIGGNHAQIAAWRREQSLRLTLERRPDLLEKTELSDQDRLILKRIQTEKDRCVEEMRPLTD